MPTDSIEARPVLENATEQPFYKRRDFFLQYFSDKHSDRWVYAHLSPLQRAVLPHTISTPDGRLVFVKNSKAGNTTIAHLLYLHVSGQVADVSIHHDRETLVQGTENWRRTLNVLRSPNSVSFSFVRNPLKRAISGFTDFFVEQRNGDAPPHVAAIEGFGFNRKADLHYRFDVFLDYVVRSMELSPVDTDKHWRLQTLNLGRPDFKLSFVGKLENLDADLAKVSDLAGIRLPMPARIANEKRNSSGRLDFRPTAGQVRRIEDIYAADYEAFGY